MEVTSWGQQVCLGPCPGCGNWQVDYDPHLFVSYAQCVRVVETVLREHLDECPHLQRLLGPGWPYDS
jgi:hypothetical protein